MLTHCDTQEVNPSLQGEGSGCDHTDQSLSGKNKQCVAQKITLVLCHGCINMNHLLTKTC